MFLPKKGNSLIKKEKKGNSLCHYDLWERQKRRRKKQKKGHYIYNPVEVRPDFILFTYDSKVRFLLSTSRLLPLNT